MGIFCDAICAFCWSFIGGMELTKLIFTPIENKDNDNYKLELMWFIWSVLVAILNLISVYLKLKTIGIY